MNNKDRMEIARRLDAIITLSENLADAVYGFDGVETKIADEVAADAAISADCARKIVEMMANNDPDFQETFTRAKSVGAIRAKMIAQKGGDA